MNIIIEYFLQIQLKQLIQILFIVIEQYNNNNYQLIEVKLDQQHQKQLNHL